MLWSMIENPSMMVSGKKDLEIIEALYESNIRGKRQLKLSLKVSMSYKKNNSKLR